MRTSEKRLKIAGKLTAKRSGGKLLFAFSPINTHSSRAVLFPIENTTRSYESAITEKKQHLHWVGRLVKRLNGTDEKISSVKTSHVINFLELS